jgi:hypothetical protein
VFPGQRQIRTGMPLRGNGHADHDLRQVIAVAPGFAEHAEPGQLLVASAGRAVVLAGLARLFAAACGDGTAAGVPEHRLVLAVHLEAGRGGVEEQQVDFEVQRGRDLAEHLLLQGVPDLVQPVHRPVARVVGGSGQPVDMRCAADPVRRRELGGRGQRPVRDQREQHPPGGRVPPGPAQHRRHDLADPQPLPQLVPQVRPAEGDRAGIGQLRGCPGRLLSLAEQPTQRPGQPLHRGPVQLVLPAEAVHDPHPRGLRHRVPLVLDQLHVADGAAIVVPPCRSAHQHVTRSSRSVTA